MDDGRVIRIQTGNKRPSGALLCCKSYFSQSDSKLLETAKIPSGSAMPKARGPDTQRPRTAPVSLDLGPLYEALPRTPLLSQQSGTQFRSTPHQEANGQQASRSLQFSQRRTIERPSTSDGSTRAKPKARALSKRPSTAEGSGIISAPSPRWERPTIADSKKLFSDQGRTGRLADPQTLAGRKGFGNNAHRLTEQDGVPSVCRLPPDLLCQCFLSVESLYYLVNCGLVCKAWREVLGFDKVWKTWYLKWWQSLDVTESSDPQSRGESQSLPHDPRTPPNGFDSWRSTFIARFQEGKKSLIVKEKEWAMREGFLGARPVTDTHGKRVLDCVQGDGMQKLSEQLGLSFSVCLNPGRHIKIQGKGKIELFQSSCFIRYPIAHIGNIDLMGLKSVEVTATSDRLLRVCPIVDITRLQSTTWEMVSMTSQSPGPLRLLQHRIAPGVSLIVGTLVDGTTDVDEMNGREQVLLIVLSIHLNNLLWKLLDLGEGPTSYAARRLVRDERDPHYGLHNWHVSVQFHTFRRNIWTRNFRQVFWNQRESIPGEKAVFLLLSHHEVFRGVLTLPWKSEAFSGSLKGVYLLDITLWDGGGEIAWQHTCAARISPAPLIVVEYGIDFDGEPFYTQILDNERGVSVAINMCIPNDFTHQQAVDERPLMAITDLQVGLTSKFLQDWCGVANI